MAQPNASFTEMTTTTLRYTKKSVADNVTDHNATLRLMKENGHIKTQGGGDEIALPLSFAENSTIQRFSGYDTLDIGATDVLTTAKYSWRNMAVHVIASGEELRKNRGEERMINLVNARVDVAKATAANTMSVDLFGTGALTNQIGGYGHIITTDGTGTVGGINSATYPMWANQFLDMSAPGTYSAVKADINTMWIRCTRGLDMPDLLIASNDIFNVYEGGLQDLQRYGETKMGALGFQALKYKSASIMHDNNTNFGSTAEKVYFLNHKYLFLIEDPDARWTQQEAKTPVNQDATVIPLLWMGALVTNWRAGQGVLFDA